jgi:hypothetical protein
MAFGRQVELSDTVLDLTRRSARRRPTAESAVSRVSGDREARSGGGGSPARPGLDVGISVARARFVFRDPSRKLRVTRMYVISMERWLDPHSCRSLR